MCGEYCSPSILFFAFWRGCLSLYLYCGFLERSMALKSLLEKLNWLLQPLYCWPRASHESWPRKCWYLFKVSTKIEKNVELIVFMGVLTLTVNDFGWITLGKFWLLRNSSFTHCPQIYLFNHWNIEYGWWW